MSGAWIGDPVMKTDDGWASDHLPSHKAVYGEPLNATTRSKMTTQKSNQVAKVAEDALPAHLQGGKTAKLGNVDSSDMIIPRIKLLQAVSPEITEFDAAKQGQFWHTVSSQLLGETLRFIPILVRKSYVLWAPRKGDDRGVLARANDAVHWDVHEKFEVKPDKYPKKVVWDTTEGTVAGSGLDKFGSSIPEDNNSPPAANLTYNLLAYLPDFPEFSPALFLLTRSGVKPAKTLISKIDMRPVDHYNQVFSVSAIEQNANGDKFFNYNFSADGYADAEQSKITKQLFERYGEADFRANDESDEGESKGSGIDASKAPF